MTDRIIMLGDVLAACRDLPDNSFDGCLCDPPYGIAFMSKKWDYDVPTTETWAEVFRVLKPGAPLIAFFGTRTYHRGVCRIEDAGFEIRDCLAWMYGQGFPKSLDVAKEIDKRAGHWRGRAGAVSSDNHAMGGPNYERTAKGAPITAEAEAWDGYGTALKPAFEPAVLARKPLDGTVAENIRKWGCGALAIDDSRIYTDWAERSEAWKSSGHSSKPDAEKIAAPPGIGITCHEAGRWPANVLLDELAGEALDAQTGTLTSGNRKPGVRKGMGFAGANGDGGPAVEGNAGGASRFFYTAKVSKAEREAGCGALEVRTGAEITGREAGSPGLDNPRSGAGGQGKARNHHPTLKPIALTRWLASLIKPPTADATLLVPFAGAGSEMIGAMQAGWPTIVGIERDPEYVGIAEARLAHWEAA